MKRYTIGLDYGTLSVRALLLDVQTGEEKAEALFSYPHGALETALPGGEALPPDWALQVPQDYLDGLVSVIRDVMRSSGVKKEEVAGIGVDFTSCTALPVDRNGTPLCEKPEFASRRNAYCKLWKHHSPQPFADRVDRLARQRQEPWLTLCGDRISSEWMLPKILETASEDPEVFRAADFILEAGDWVIWKLTGVQRRSACTAAFKAFYLDGSYPSEEFLRELDPALGNLEQTKLAAPHVPVGGCAGQLSAEMAETLGLCAGTPVAAAVIDAHASLPACGVCTPGSLLLIIGTSSCHILLSDRKVPVSGVCSVARDGIIPGMYAYESGQTCVGDSFSWYVNNCVPAALEEEAARKGQSIHDLLREKAEALVPGESGLVALDWFHGARSPWMDSSLSGVIAGITTATRPEEIYRAILESTAFGTRLILENFEEAGAPVEQVSASGGIPLKNPLMMQIYADVCGRPITVSDCRQSGARGSAIYAAAAAGLGGVAELSRRLGRPGTVCYRPIPENVRRYEELYQEYLRLSRFLARESRVLHHLHDMRENQ